MKNDTYSTLKSFERAQDPNKPADGTIKAVRGLLADVLVPSMNTILRGVKVIGTPAVGLQVSIQWIKGIPVAAVVNAAPTIVQVAGLVTGPQGPKGDTGAQGPQGPAVGNLDGGLPSSTYGGINPIDCGGVV